MLEAYGHFEKSSVKPCHNPVNQAAADDSLADGGGGGPLRTVSQQVVDGDDQIVVWVLPTGESRNDAMTICVRVALLPALSL